MTSDSIPSFETMLDALSRNPLKAVQLASKVNDGINRRSYEVVGIACGFTRVLIDDERHRADFYEEEFFENRKRARPDKLLLHVLAYVYGALSGPAYNRASEHARALAEVCDNRDIAVADIPKHIAEHGGFDGLLGEEDADERMLEDDQEASADASLSERSNKPGVAQRPSKPDAALTADDNGLDDDDLIGEASEEEGLVDRPKRKVPKPEVTEPKLTLLPRDLIAAYMLVRPRTPLTIGEIWQALKKGKKVNADLVMGETSAIHELYTGGGAFIDVYVEEMVTS